MLALKLCKHLDRGDCSRLVSLLRNEGFGPRTLIQLHQLVTTELSSEHFSRVQLMIKALEKICENKENLQTLLTSGLTSKLLWWYRSVLELLTCDLSQSTALGNLCEAFFDFFLEMAKPFVPVSHVRVILLYLSRTALEPTIIFRLRLEAIRTLNSCLESQSPEQWRALQAHQEIKCNLSEMVAALFTVGDYELQACLTESLCRLTLKADRPVRASEWFSPELSQAFAAIRNGVFEVDCRRYLNLLNRNHGDQRRVFTFPCLQALFDSTELFRPQEENLEEFWIDFNLGSECLSFFVDDPKMRQRSMWESIRVQRSEVSSCSLTEANGTSVLLVDLTKPLLLENFKGQRLVLHFEAEHHSELSHVVTRVFKKLLVPRSSIQTYHKRAPKKKKLRVLPLSSPSSDEGSAQSFQRSRAEFLFDQIQQSTPIREREALLHVVDHKDHFRTTDSLNRGRKSPFPDSVLPRFSQSSVSCVENEEMDSVTKKSCPESGYFSPSMTFPVSGRPFPERTASLVGSTELSDKEEYMVERLIPEMVEFAADEEEFVTECSVFEESEFEEARSEFGNKEIVEEKTDEFVDEREEPEEDHFIEERAVSGQKVVKDMAESGQENVFIERAESAKEKTESNETERSEKREDPVKEKVESATQMVGSTTQMEEGSPTTEDKSVRVKWDWSTESVEQSPDEHKDKQCQSQEGEMHVLRFETEGMTAGVAWKHILEVESLGGISTSQLSYNSSCTWKPRGCGATGQGSE